MLAQLALRRCVLVTPLLVRGVPLLLPRAALLHRRLAAVFSSPRVLARRVALCMLRGATSL